MVVLRALPSVAIHTSSSEYRIGVPKLLVCSKATCVRMRSEYRPWYRVRYYRPAMAACWARAAIPPLPAAVRCGTFTLHIKHVPAAEGRLQSPR